MDNAWRASPATLVSCDSNNLICLLTSVILDHVWDENDHDTEKVLKFKVNLKVGDYWSNGNEWRIHSLIEEWKWIFEELK